MHTNRKLIFLNLLLTLVIAAGMLGGSGLFPRSTGPQAAYIVQGPDHSQLVALVTRYGGKITSDLEIISGVTANLPVDAVARLSAESGITNVSTDAKVAAVSNAAAPVEKANPPKTKGSEDYTSPATDYPNVVGADVVWAAGNIGSGVSVAVVDTGIAPLAGVTKSAKGDNGRIVAWKDFVDDSGSPMDPNGHGTHVAGIIANSQKGTDKEWNGVAPGVNLVGVRVLNDQGAGRYGDIIRGIQWVIQNKDRYNIRVINLSLSGDVHSPYWADPLDQAVTRAWAEGIVVVVSAGNKGPAPMTIGVPANDPYAITVGTFTDHFTPTDWTDDYIANFSSAGPTLDGFVKPDVVAPGAHMVSTMSDQSVIAQSGEATKVQPNYYSMAGTSQSAAVVSGVSALIISNNPGLKPDQVKFRVMAAARPWVNPTTLDALYSAWQQGAGRVTAPDAVMGKIRGQANAGMDIRADLKGKVHYEGYSYYDAATGTFRVKAPIANDSPYSVWGGTYTLLTGRYGAWSDKYGAWSDKYGAWSDKYGAWSDKYGAWSDRYGAWSDKYGAWSDKYGAWSDKYGAWSDKYGAWSDKYGAWSDKYGAWSDGYTGWAGGYAAWNGKEPWSATLYAQPGYIASFKAGAGPNPISTSTTIGIWVSEP